MKIQYALLLGLVIGCALPRTPFAADRYTVIADVNVVDVIAGAIRPGRTVVLRDSLIFFIGDAWTPPAAARVTRVDGTGQYLLPGLWDMHFHLAWDPGNDTLLYPPLLANGITGLRDMGGDLAIQRRLKTRLARGAIVGPELVGAGPILDGNPPVLPDFSLPLDDASDVPLLLDSLVAAGADFCKVYSLLREPELREIAAFAESRRVPFAGHLSEYVEPEISIGLGQRSIEHLNRLSEIWATDTARLARVADTMVARGTWLCPTLVVYHRKATLADATGVNPAYETYILPGLRAEWEASRTARRARGTDRTPEERLAQYRREADLVAYLHRRGVPILAGSDFAGMPYVYPGIGLIEELQLLGEAGLTPTEVLRTATIEPARYFGRTDRYGTVSEGKYADLILLSKNPLTDTAHLTSLKAVFTKGRLTEPGNS